MRFDPARIDNANAAISVYDLIEYVADHSRPRKIHCPVHDDSSKSAQVYPDSNSVYCWTCGRAYDVIALVMEAEGLEFMAAVSYIERMAGIKWEKVERPDSEFWELVKKAERDPDDPTYWSEREKVLYRWAVHRTVFELVPEPDWEGFDDAHLDIDALRKWRDSQLTRDLTGV